MLEQGNSGSGLAVPHPSPGANIAPPGAVASSVSPLASRTFANSNFRKAYETTNSPSGPLELGAALKDLLRLYCEAENIPFGQDAGYHFFTVLQKEAMQNSEELADGKLISVAAQRMWTSAYDLRGREFCFIINYALRADTPQFVEAVVVLSRAMNELCVTRRVPHHLFRIQSVYCTRFVVD